MLANIPQYTGRLVWAWEKVKLETRPTYAMEGCSGAAGPAPDLGNQLPCLRMFIVKKVGPGDEAESSSESVHLVGLVSLEANCSNASLGIAGAHFQESLMGTSLHDNCFCVVVSGVSTVSTTEIPMLLERKR